MTMKDYTQCRFLQLVREFNKYSQNNWEVKVMKIIKYFTGNMGIWAEACCQEWEDIGMFERTFINTFWS